MACAIAVLTASLALSQGKLSVKREEVMMQMLSNPDALGENMKRQMVFVVQQSLMFGYVSYFFSGFVMGARAAARARASMCA